MAEIKAAGAVAANTAPRKSDGSRPTQPTGLRSRHQLLLPRVRAPSTRAPHHILNRLSPSSLQFGLASILHSSSKLLKLNIKFGRLRVHANLFTAPYLKKVPLFAAAWLKVKKSAIFYRILGTAICPSPQPHLVAVTTVASLVPLQMSQAQHI